MSLKEGMQFFYLFWTSFTVILVVYVAQAYIQAFIKRNYDTLHGWLTLSGRKENTQKS